MATKLNFVGCMILMITFINAIININGYILPNVYNKGGGNNYKRQSLKLRNSNNNLFCNEKFIYMKYLVGIRNFKKLYRIIKDNSNIDIQNIINIFNNINITQLANIADNNYNNSLFINNSMFINNTYCNNNNKTVKNLVLSNIYIDVSNIKYIQISTRNDTLIFELDKNNANIEAIEAPVNNLMYDITKIETLVSSISLIMKVLNIN